MRIGVPLLPGMDPVPLAILDRLAAQANLELRLRGDPRHLEVVRLSDEPHQVTLLGGTQVRPDVTYDERPGLDVVYLVGTTTDSDDAVAPPRALIDWLAGAKSDLQHLVGVGEGVEFVLETHLATARRVMVNHLTPRTRARFDSVIAAHDDPCRDGHLWTASDPLHAGVLILDLIGDLFGRDVGLGIELRVPWLTTLRKATSPRPPVDTDTSFADNDDDDDDDDPDDDRGGDGLRIRPGPTTGF